MAEAFGQLRTTAAIPFLIENISIDSFPVTNVWARGDDQIRRRLVAANALILIGPESSRALMRGWHSPMPGQDRIAAVFVISKIKGVPEARAFLSAVKWEAGIQLRYAEQGLKKRD
jgi:hypothetical protein